MKNRVVCLLCLAVAFIACDKDDDLMVGNSGSLVCLQSADQGGITRSTLSASRRDTCLDLTTMQWLHGAALLQPIYEMAKPQEEAGAVELPSQRYVVEAAGDAMSEYLARGHSELNLIYYNNPHRMSGKMVTTFFYGEVLELEFEGITQLQSEGQILHVEVDVKEATLRAGTELYMLDEGVVRFSISRQPEGPISVDVELLIKICS